MISLVHVVIAAGIAIIVIAIVKAVQAADKKRSDAIKHAGLKFGFSYTVEDPSLLDQFRYLPLFTHGHAKRIRHVLSGNRSGKQWKVFDYRFTIGGGKSSHTYQQIVAVVDMALPSFVLDKEGLGQKIMAAFGKNDIDFPDFPEFSKRYFLKGSDEHAIRALFTPERIRYLQDKDIRLQSDGERVLLYKRKRPKPDQYGSFITETEQAFKLFER